MEKSELEFETLKSNKNRLYLLCGIVCVVVLLITVIVSNTFAKYRVRDSVPIINSEINYKVPDLNMVSLYVTNEEGDYVEADTIPSSGYILNTEQSYCGQSNNGEIFKDDSVILTYENGSMTFSNLTAKGTKCYLYFDIEEETSGESILANYPTVLTRGDFNTTITEKTTGTIYYADTSKGRTYYFAGNPTDNWVKFAGFYWRIIRINEDGSIRLIYNGTRTSTTGSSSQIGTSGFNNLYNNNMYVGYMYQSNQVHGLTTDSTIKIELDQWYEENLQSHADKISHDAGFCGDREPSTSSDNSNGLGGIGNTYTYYGTYIRLRTNKMPSFECTNTADLYTVASSSQGNKALDYPIGLITADEVAFAGGVYRNSNSSYFLYNGQDYWTISPSSTTNGNAVVFRMTLDGYLYTGDNVSGTYGVRPVINLSADVTITGSGTTSDPYLIS